VKYHGYPGFAMYFEGWLASSDSRKLPTLRSETLFVLLYSSPREPALFVVSGSETMDSRSSCTERNSSPDNSAICDGLAARQEAARPKKGISHVSLACLDTRRHLRQALPTHQPLLRAIGSYAVAAFACVPFISHSA
jgi:hypothetical protein